MYLFLTHGQMGNYGDPILRWMNIHLPANLIFTRGTPNSYPSFVWGLGPKNCHMPEIACF